jgi:hypothetical protein
VPEDEIIHESTDIKIIQETTSTERGIKNGNDAEEVQMIPESHKAGPKEYQVPKARTTNIEATSGSDTRKEKATSSVPRGRQPAQRRTSNDTRYGGNLELPSSVSTAEHRINGAKGASIGDHHHHHPRRRESREYTSVTRQRPSHPPESSNETLAKESEITQVPTENVLNETFVQVSTTTPKRESMTAAQKIITVSGIEGKLSLLNVIAKEHNARAVIHTGNFGFYDADSYKSVPIEDLKYALDRELGHDEVSRLSEEKIRDKIEKRPSLLSEFVEFIAGTKRLNVPVYVVWGQFEDSSVIERLRKGVYYIPNLHILDHRNSYAISTGSTTLRLFGLGGIFSYPRLFDVGKSGDAVSGGEGRVWANLMQMGELIDFAERYDDPTETRVFVSQSSAGKEPLACILANTIKAQFTIGAGNLACSVYNGQAVHSAASLMKHLQPTLEDLKSMWDQVYFACNDKFSETQAKSCKKIISVIDKFVLTESDVRRMTHISVCPIAAGYVKLGLTDVSISVEVAFELNLNREQPGRKGTVGQVKEPLAKLEPAVQNDEPISSPSGKPKDMEGELSVSSDGPAFYLDTKPNIASDWIMFVPGIPFGMSPEEIRQELFSKYNVTLHLRTIFML